MAAEKLKSPPDINDSYSDLQKFSLDDLSPDVVKFLSQSALGLIEWTNFLEIPEENDDGLFQVVSMLGLAALRARDRADQVGAAAVAELGRTETQYLNEVTVSSHEDVKEMARKILEVLPSGGSLLAIEGDSGSGKDYLSIHLVEHLGYKQVSLGGGFRALTKALLLLAKSEDESLNLTDQKACDQVFKREDFNEWVVTAIKTNRVKITPEVDENRNIRESIEIFDENRKSVLIESWLQEAEGFNANGNVAAVSAITQEVGLSYAAEAIKLLQGLKPPVPVLVQGRPYTLKALGLENAVRVIVTNDYQWMKGIRRFVDELNKQRDSRLKRDANGEPGSTGEDINATCQSLISEMLGSINKYSSL